MDSSIELINLSGRKVRVAARREDFLVSQGFTRPVPPKPIARSTPADNDFEPRVVVLEDLTKAELWARIKEADLDDQVSYRDTKDAMIEAFSGE